jgi:predicted small lipoprotein YifL
MLKRRLAITTVVLALLVSFFMVGCGPKPPCPVPPEEVRAAQDKTNGVKADLDAAVAEREAKEKELSQKEAKLKQLKAQDLEKELEMLKKGSGR